MTDTLALLRKALGTRLLSIAQPVGNRWFLELDGAIRLAAETLGGARLITISCIDNPPYLELLYHFDIPGGVMTLREKVWKPENSTDSISAIIPAAELIEHEITEMFGLRFNGNPRPDNLILSSSQNSLTPLRNRVSALEARMDGNVSNIVEHGSTTAPSKRVMKSRSNVGMPENPPLCSVTCPAKNIVCEIAESTGTASRHPNLRKKEGGK